METKDKEIIELELDSICANEFNPNEMSDAKFAALVDSLKKDGQQQPILVRVIKGDVSGKDYELIDGFWRSKALLKLGKQKVRAVVKDVDNVEAMRLCYKINEARGALTPFKEAVFFTKLSDAGFDDKKAAKEYGVSEQYVKDRKLLMAINQEQKELLEKTINKETELTPGHWLVYAKLTPEERIVFCKELKTKTYSLPVRQFESEAKDAKKTVAETKKFLDVLSKAKIQKCPTCNGPAIGLDYDGKNLRCKDWHDWHPMKGQPQQRVLSSTGKVEKKTESKKPKYPHWIQAETKLKDIDETLLNFVVTNARKIESVNFDDDKGHHWSLTRTHNRFKIAHGKPYHGPEIVLLEDGGKVKFGSAYGIDSAMHKDREQMAKLFGIKLVPNEKKVPKKTVKNPVPKKEAAK